MIGFVLVSHSRSLAEATRQLVLSMSGEEVPVAIAAGTGENHLELGTDAVEISEAITTLSANEGIVVMMDMGSAVLSTEMALDFLDEELRGKVRLCPYSFVEGSVVGGVVAKTGGSMEDILREASFSLQQKTEHIAGELPEDKNQPSSLSPAKKTVSVNLTVPIPHGIHARPAARLVQLASRFSSDIRMRDVTNNKGPVPVKSITGVMTLEALYGHEMEITASGEDAERALQEITREFQAGLGDKPVEETGGEKQSEPDIHPEEGNPIGVSKGVVIAPLYFPEQFSYIFPDEQISDKEQETEKLQTALTVTRNVLNRKADDVTVAIGKEKGEIFRAQATMLDDPALQDRAVELIREKSMPAPQAWWTAVCEVMENYKKLQDANLRQRVLDLQDVAQLVLVQFGIKDNATMDIPGTGIILVDDLTPGQVTSLNKEKVAGVICLENGPTSHSAILLRSRGIPSIVQARRFPVMLRNLAEGTTLAMDGATGEIWVELQGEALMAVEKRMAEWQTQKEAEKEESSQPAVTTDGEKIAVYANVGDRMDVQFAVNNNAEGIGLLRTEFMFLHREKSPTEQEQVDMLLDMLKPAKELPVVIRTLDAGGDKQLSYLHLPEEENPFLGIRAIRLTLRNPDLFRQQLRAVLRVGAIHDVRIMFPMISTLSELQSAKKALEEAHLSLEKDQMNHRWPVSTGMMMEVPSAAIMAHQFAPEVDFMSIGTNDLLQYTLAVDRTNPQLQDAFNKGFDPSVLLLISHICKSCEERGISVSVCGESAADPATASLLIGAGVTTLSMNPASIPELKRWIRSQSHAALVKQVEDGLFYRD